MNCGEASPAPRVRVARHHVARLRAKREHHSLSPRVAQSWVFVQEVRAAPRILPQHRQGRRPEFVIPILGQKHQPVARESHLVGVRSPQSVRVARHRGGHGEGVLVVRSGWTRGGALRRLRVPEFGVQPTQPHLRRAVVHRHPVPRQAIHRVVRLVSAMKHAVEDAEGVPMSRRGRSTGKRGLESMQHAARLPSARRRTPRRDDERAVPLRAGHDAPRRGEIRGNVHHPFRAHELFLSESRTPTAAAADDSARPAVGPLARCRTRSAMGRSRGGLRGATAKRRLVVDVLVAVVDVDVYGGGGGVLAELGDGGVVVSRGEGRRSGRGAIERVVGEGVGGDGDGRGGIDGSERQRAGVVGQVATRFHLARSRGVSASRKESERGR